MTTEDRLDEYARLALHMLSDVTRHILCRNPILAMEPELAPLPPEWPDADDREGAITYMERGPGLCAESAQWLADHGIVTVMIDGPAIDSAAHMPYGDGTMQSHVVLFRYNIPAVEGLGGEIDLG